VEATPENTAFPQAQARRADSCNIQSDPAGDGQAQRSPNSDRLCWDDPRWFLNTSMTSSAASAT